MNLEPPVLARNNVEVNDWSEGAAWNLLLPSNSSAPGRELRTVSRALPNAEAKV
jgi:hypothetical protein